MIKHLFSIAVIVKDFIPTGISNVIQTVENNEILYIYAKSKIQLDSLIENNLATSFNGLIISPFTPKRRNLNYCILSLVDMKASERDLIEYFYPPLVKVPKIVGITGTNGKTSSCWFLMELGRLIGLNILYMGTIGVYIAGQKKEDRILTTTPSLLSLRKLQSKYSKEIDVIALEVSSHALEQNRIDGIMFDVIGWTNFTQDHLDFHNDMRSYFNSKLKILLHSKTNEITISRKEKSLIQKLEKKSSVIETIDLDLLKIKVPSFFKEGFSRDNVEMAITCLEKLVNKREVIDLTSMRPPPGRFELIEKKSALFIIDYAHTPDALEKVLEQVRFLYPKCLLITVFGCGGDRDKLKRPLMLMAALKNSNRVIVTSDNPRTESPEQIIKDITHGSTGFEYEVDREVAIMKSYVMAKNNVSEKKVVIVIAGKGDENYQEINGVRHDFSDALIVRELH